MAYSPEEIEETFLNICKEMSDGKSLIKCLREFKVGNSTFFEWLHADKEKQENYARACAIRADILFDEIIDIADTTEEGKIITTDESGKTKETVGDMIQHRRLKIDARKWHIARTSPKKYGEKTINENHNKNENINIEVSPEEFKNLSSELDTEY